MNQSLGALAHDTIAAIATPPGISALAVLRVSGHDAADIISGLSSGKSFKPRYAHRCRLSMDAGNHILDDVIITWFPRPDSYTGDDVFEISCHGGYHAADTVLKAIISRGARMALPGEFTQRAFMNGKLDLLQVEAIADIIHGHSRRQLEIAQRILKGELSTQVRSIKKQLIDAATIIELELDFSDQEIEKTEDSSLYELLRSSRDQLNSLLMGYEDGRLSREGLRTTIIGRPNAGKSTLLNLLLGSDRAITSDIPGTTRDTIEESFILKDQLFILTDTAGIRDSNDPLELEGIRRSHAAVQDSDMLILLIDSSLPGPWSPETELLDRYSKPALVIFTKSDLAGSDENRKSLLNTFGSLDHLFTNLKSPENKDGLLKKIADLAEHHFGLFRSSNGISRLRHYDHVLRSQQDLLNAMNALKNGIGHELVSIDIRNAIAQLDGLTGETRSEDILNNIFNEFCIGK